MLKFPKRKILLNPGPLTTTQRVKEALIVSDICPRENEFGDLLAQIAHGLKRVVHAADDYEVVLFSGSGTAAVEATISSVVSDNEAILVLDNGAYGARMLQIAKIHYAVNQVFHIQLPHTDQFNLDQIESLLKLHPNIRHVAMVHHETTTGMLNAASDLLKLLNKYDVALILDAMSSYAGLPMDMSKDAYHYVISSSNKCIQGIPGLSFVICKNSELKKTQNIKPKSLYLNLWKQYEFFSQYHQMQFTPPVQVCYALKAALDEFFEEGQEARYERYKKSWETLVVGIDRLGLELLLPTGVQSKLLTAIKEPSHPNYSFEDMHAYFKVRDITIYPGKTHIADTFRIANIGAVDYQDICLFIKYLEEYLRLKKIFVPK